MSPESPDEGPPAPLEAWVEDLTRAVLDAAFEVHTVLGPGLLERIYRGCLADELRERGFRVEEELWSPVVYKGKRREAGYRIDLLVNEAVIVEVKAVENFHPTHTAQLYTYLKLSGCTAGLLLNFQTRSLRKGIRRVIRTR